MWAGNRPPATDKLFQYDDSLTQSNEEAAPDNLESGEGGGEAGWEETSRHGQALALPCPSQHGAGGGHH